MRSTVTHQGVNSSMNVSEEEKEVEEDGVSTSEVTLSVKHDSRIRDKR